MLIAAAILLISMIFSSLNTAALSNGATVNYKVDDSCNATGGFVTFQAGELNGSCVQKGTDYVKTGKATMSLLANTSLLAKAAYFVDIQSGWFGNNTDRPKIMDTTGVAARFRAGLLAEDVVQCANQGTSKWSEIALRQLYPKDYVDYVVALVVNYVPYVEVPSNFIIYKGKPSDNSQDFAVWGFSPQGYCCLIKETEPGKTINDYSRYSLAGAVYYVYTDETCTNMAIDAGGNFVVLTTNADGVSNMALVNQGIYWAKEVTPSPGHKPDETARAVIVTGDNTAGNPAVFRSVEPIITGHVTLKKKAAPTTTDYLREAPNNYSLGGAKYELYSDAACTKRAKDVSGKDITLTTKADGTTETVEVSIGNYYAKEVTASKGYKFDSSVRSTEVTGANTRSAPAQISSTEEPVYAPFEFAFRKVDISGHHGYKELLGTEFTISYYDADMGYGSEQPTASVIAGMKARRSWTYSTVKKLDQNGQPYAGFNTKEDEPESGSSPFYTENGKKVLPRGVFTIEETKAAPGMARNKTVYYCRVFQARNGSAAATVFDAALTSGADLTLNLDDDVQHPVIEIQKKDADTGEASPQGADRENVKGSLAGARYAVYFDDPEKSEPERVGTIVTDENGYGKLEKRMEGDKRFIGDWLPLGGYFIEEVSAPDGYTVDAMYYENKDGEYRDGQHIVFARALMGDVESFTYTIESMERPHHTHIYKTDLVTTKEIPGATLQVIDSEGNLVEEWTSTEKPHDIVALHDETQGLKNGKYTLREITAPYGYDTAEDIEFEVRSGKIANKVEMKNAPISIYTNAVDEETQSHHGSFSKTEKIRDIVKYENLYAGRTYTFRGTLVDKKTEEPLKDRDGNEITAEKEFTPEGEKGSLVSGEVELEFIVDASDFTKERSVVAFEKLYREEREIAMHADLSDEDQTIRYGGIAYTVAVDAKSKGHNILGDKDAVITDTVKYRNLSTTETYTLEGELFDKTTGKLTGIKAKRSFRPASPDGSTTVEFRFDASDLKGHKLVAFEKLYVGEKEVDSHEDPDDADQTVNVPEIETIAVDPESNEHIANAGKSVTVKDTVKYRNLFPGRTYTIRGTLQYRDGLLGRLRPVMKDGRPLTAVASFTPESEDGSVDVLFVFDAADLAGKTTVVFEDLYDGEYLIATHADPYDEDQSVHFPKIATRLGRKSGRHVYDTVIYKNLIPGKTYIVRGYFVEKSSGKKIKGSDGKLAFVPETADGKVEVKLNTKGSVKTLVAFESIYLVTGVPDAPGAVREVLVGEHKDLKDKAQTLVVRAVPDTGDRNRMDLLVFIFTAAVLAFSGFAIRKAIAERRQARDDFDILV